jgi:hypothetical protein
VTPVNQEVTGLLMKRRNQGVLLDTIIIAKGTPRREHTVVQAHILLESIDDMEWMN